MLTTKRSAKYSSRRQLNVILRFTSTVESTSWLMWLPKSFICLFLIHYIFVFTSPVSHSWYSSSPLSSSQFYFWLKAFFFSRNPQTGSILSGKGSWTVYSIFTLIDLFFRFLFLVLTSFLLVLRISHLGLVPDSLVGEIKCPISGNPIGLH